MIVGLSFRIKCISLFKYIWSVKNWELSMAYYFSIDIPFGAPWRDIMAFVGPTSELIQGSDYCQFVTEEMYL